MLNSIKLLTLLALALTFTACGDDDEMNNNDLVGTWRAESFSFSADISTTFIGQTTQSMIDGMGTDLNYELVFTETDFTTSGNYSYTLSGDVNGQAVPTTSETVTNVRGSGTYTATESTITVDGQLFELTYEGQDLSTTQEAQTVDYEINAEGKLVFNQEETMELNESGVISTTQVISTSVWVRQ